ncbi:hypothetical protein ACOV11_26005, partial [Vibrio natriegens]
GVMPFDVRDETAGPVKFAGGNTRDEVIIIGDLGIAQAVNMSLAGLPVYGIGALEVAGVTQRVDFCKRPCTDRDWIGEVYIIGHRAPLVLRHYRQQDQRVCDQSIR